MGGDERPQGISRQRRSARWDGFSLIEVMTAVAIMSVVIGMAVPSIIEWRSHYEAKKAARTLADIFHKARTEAMRTGDQQVVFFGNPGLTDPGGNATESIRPSTAVTLASSASATVRLMCKRKLGPMSTA